MGLLALGGCTFDSPGSPTQTGSPTALSDEDYDRRLIDEAALGIAGALAMIEEIAARFDLVAGSLAPLVAMHDAHLSTLGVITPPEVAAPQVGGQPRAALARLGSLEKALQLQLVAVAQNARSGQLARVFAGMSAGVHQHVLVSFPVKSAEVAP